MKKNVKELLKAVRNKMLTLGLTVSGLGTAASVQAAPLEGIPETNSTNTTHAAPDAKTRTLRSVAEAEYKTCGVYKGGIEVDFAECTPHHLGWVFESGLKPGIVDPSNSYIGLFQMDLGATMATFLKENKDKYPKLAAVGKTKEMRKIKNGPFQKMWKELDSPEFRKAQADFMEKYKYEPIFEELRKVEGLDIDNRGDALHGAIASAANQYRKDVVIKMLKSAFHNAAAGKKLSEVKTDEIISNFYDQRVQRSPGLKNRLLGVTNKKGKKIVYGEKDMALDYHHYLEREQLNKLAEKDKTLTLPIEIWSIPKLVAEVQRPKPDEIRLYAAAKPDQKDIYKKRSIINKIKNSR